MPRILGIVPARGGSKGVPNKNLLKLGDRFLLGMVADAMLDSGCVDLALCSTDSEAIADVASQVGLKIPFLRPESLANDNSLVVDAVNHAVEQLAAVGEYFDIVCLLQVSSPLVSADHVKKAIGLLIESDCDSVITAHRVSKPDPCIMFSSEGGRVSYLLPQMAKMRRQEWPAFYARAGLVYAFKTKNLDAGTIYGTDIRFIEVEADIAVDIDEPEDLRVIELMTGKKFCLR